MSQSNATGNVTKVKITTVAFNSPGITYSTPRRDEIIGEKPKTIASRNPFDNKT